jgi:outer membrane protein OmpA-like peptidoglycan-associated protein
MSPIAFSSAELRFSDSRVASGSASIAAPRVAALPGGMAMREEGRGLRVTLDADVLFDFDRAELRPEAGPRLQRLMAEVSARIPRPAFRVEGHTDWIGSDAYNLRLSARRADSVRTWLVQAGGVPRPAVSTAGFGESRPVAPNSTPDGRDDPDGRQRNRRVELLVTPR